MIASIDIGTSYSSICILGPDGKAQPVDIATGTNSTFGGKYSLPSAVFVEDSGKVVVGQAAMNSRRHRLQNFRMEFKRNLGEEIPILLGPRSFKPEELYTELFRHMKAKAEDVGGEQIEKTYLTHPASYGEKRLEKLRSAAKAAGLFDLELVDEPTAAAMCYCTEGYVRDGQTLLIYDFGGGTFDVSLIRYQDGAFQLLSEPMGLERCGGMDIDYLIAQDMKAAINKEVPGAWEDLQKNQNRFMRVASQIDELAVRAKHHLSDANHFEEYIEIGMDDVPYELTVERLNEMIAPLVGQTLQLCRQALDEAGISSSELSAVLMVGGTSRIPLVREMVRKITGKPPLCAADLELAVARGALEYRRAAPQNSMMDESDALDLTAEECFQKGLDAKQEEEIEEAEAWYRKAADLGHTEAMIKLGSILEDYARHEDDEELSELYYTEAAELYRKAVESGDPNGMFYLGMCYQYGTGVEKNYKQAMQWYRKDAEENGDSVSAWSLGELYEEGGPGLRKDMDQAVYWYQKAARMGQEEAEERLSEIAVEYFNKGYATAEREAWREAVQWYRRAADLGDSDAMNNLGLCYKNGQGVAQDYGQAVYWYQEAADLGNALAMYNLGTCYDNGQGVAQDYGQAVYWYRKAADLGQSLAMNNLGSCYKNGEGVPKDYYRAVYWYRKAADLGESIAMYNLGLCYENGQGVAKDRGQAVYWYRKAANLGYDNARSRLGKLGEC